MTVLSIILYFLFSFALLSAILPLIHFERRYIVFIIKGILIVSVLFACCSKISSNCAPIPYKPDFNPSVYSTNTGSHYHRSGCGSLWNSSWKTTLYDATLNKLSPCSRCYPPEYSAETKLQIEDSLKSRGPEFDEFIMSIEYISCAALLALLLFLYFRFHIFDNFISRLGNYLQSFINHIVVLSSIFFFPGCLFAFTSIYVIISTFLLVSIPFRSTFSAIKRLVKKRSGNDPNIIKVKIDFHNSELSHTSSIADTPPETIYSMKSANSMTVRVPKNKLDTSPSYRVCHFLWTRSIIFCEHIRKNPPLTCQTYIWTAFFYSITKHIRNQDLVDDIYSQLIPATEPFTSKIENKTRLLDCIQSAYRRFRSVLNDSGIDPRNECGIAELWAITAQWAFPNIALTENEEKAFMYNTLLVTNRALEIYKLKPTETIYYMEAANGMTVRVPESKLEAWQEEQDRQRKGIGTELTDAEKKLRDRILRDIYGPRE